MGLIKRREDVPSLQEVGGTHRGYREYLRVDFWYSCAYCTMAESEGGAYQIDHFVPQAAGGSSDYGNLMYSCDECNRFKSAYSPPDDTTQARGLRFVRPDQDHPREHYLLDRDQLRHKTAPGKFTISMLFLNRQSLQRLRSIRRRLYNSQRATLGGLQGLRRIPLDRLPRRVRGLAVRRRDELVAEGRAAIAALDDLLRSLQQSPLLDADPKAEQRTQERRKYVADLKVHVHPGPWFHRKE